MKRMLAVCLVVLSLGRASAGEKPAKVIRVGIIGLDTSHVIAFTKVLNNPDNSGDLAGVRVVAGYPGGSKDIPDSFNRVGKFTESLRKDGIKIVDSIEEMLKEVDAVLLESVDGRPHLDQVIPVLKAGKIVFIDKPIAGSLADALRIFQLSQQYKVPVFSSSSLRYYPWVRGVREDPKLGKKVVGATVHAPCALEPHHPDLFWYGIHGVETLFAIMGTGCKTVQRTTTKGTDVVTGTWADGRVATFRGIREGASGYAATVYGDKGILHLSGSGSYQPLVVEICKFFRTGQPPVSAAETIELFAFMEAADESKRQSGAPVTIEGVIKKAQEENRKKDSSN